jgi:adenylate cyclase
MQRTLAAYLPQDRRQALARGEDLPKRTAGAALFADISGFTPLTEALASQLGPRRGAEALTLHLDRVYNALIAEVERCGGSVIGFAGDSITCWFDESVVSRPWPVAAASPSEILDNGQRTTDDGQATALRAVACALALQQAMRPFAAIALPNGTITTLALKVAVAAGPARRFVVGDPNIQLIDALAGATISRTASAEHLARPGEILLDMATTEALGDAIQVAEWRADAQTGERFAVIATTDHRPPTTDPGPSSPGHPVTLSPEQLRSWLLPAVYAREQAGLGAFLTEFRPAVALFLRFDGLEYDDDQAGDQLDTFICRAQAVLARSDGTLVQLTIGDKGSYLYAVFGAPTAHENDPRRAVHAALDLRNAAAEFGFLAPVQIGLSRGIMRAGTCGSTTRRTYAVLGDDVNLAARLMSQAAPGEILVSGRVQKAIADVFACEPRGPIALKGKAAPLPIFAVRGALQRRAIRLQEPSYALPMIGRADELALVETKLSLAAHGQGQIVGITAEAGMGKSRLLAEVIRLAHRRSFTGYGGACQSDGTNTPYLAWRPIWSALFDLDPAAPLRKQIRTLERALEDRAPARVDALPLLGTLLGVSLPDNDFTGGLAPKERKSALDALLLDCLASAAHEAAHESGGLLLVLEDLHWIDPASHDLLEEVGRASATLPILIVLAYRPPELQRLQAPRVEALDHFTKLTLTELNEAEAAQAIGAKLAQLFPARMGTVPPALVAQLTATAQGNPFYLEELLNYLHDRGIDPREQTALEQIALPDSLHTLILSRIDQLSTHQQLTLKVASVIGRQFSFTHLRGYAPVLGDEQPLRADLDELARLELTPLDTPEPELAYLFKHIVTHEVAYESLAYATRAILHEQYARFVEAAADEAVERWLDLLAYHYDRTENLAKRREYLRRAGDAAQAAYANASALDYYARLLPLLNDPRELSQATLTIGYIYFRQAEFAAAVRQFEEGVALARAVGDTAGMAGGIDMLGTIALLQSDFASARPRIEESLALRRASGDKSGTGWALNHLGQIATVQSHYAPAAAIFEESITLFRAIGDTFGLAYALTFAGENVFAQGDLAMARELFEESLVVSRAVGDKIAIGNALFGLGRVALEEGDTALARPRGEEGLALSRAIGNQYGTAQALGLLGAVALEGGDTAAARALYDEGLALSRAIGAKWSSAEYTLSLGLVARTEGQLDQAEALFAEALAQFHALGIKGNVASGLVSLAIVAADRAVDTQAVAFAQRAARLAGATAALLETIQAPLDRQFRKLYEEAIATAQAALGDEAFAAAWEAGKQLTLDEAVAFALAPEATAS